MDPHELKPVSIANPTQSVESFTNRLTGEQLDCLSRCAKGNTLRFEAQEIVHAIVGAGYAQKSMGGIVTVTATGQQYLAALARKSRQARRL
jgi:superfamily II DNA or RNA helicase